MIDEESPIEHQKVEVEPGVFVWKRKLPPPPVKTKTQETHSGEDTPIFFILLIIFGLIMAILQTSGHGISTPIMRLGAPRFMPTTTKIEYVTVCEDGTYSYTSGSGACSWHGGVSLKDYRREIPPASPLWTIPGNIIIGIIFFFKSWFLWTMVFPIIALFEYILTPLYVIPISAGIVCIVAGWNTLHYGSKESIKTLQGAWLLWIFPLLCCMAGAETKEDLIWIVGLSLFIWGCIFVKGEGLKTACQATIMAGVTILLAMGFILAVYATGPVVVTNPMKPPVLKRIIGGFNDEFYDHLIAEVIAEVKAEEAAEEATGYKVIYNKEYWVDCGAHPSNKVSEFQKVINAEFSIKYAPIDYKAIVAKYKTTSNQP